MNTIKVALACSVLLFCIGQSGCDRKPTLATPNGQTTHDTNGYLIQPGNDFLVGGQSPGWSKIFFIQIEVDGHDENRPFILTVGDEILPHDNWPLAIDRPRRWRDNNTDTNFLPHANWPLNPAATTRAWGGVSLNPEDVIALTEAVRKYFAWSDIATKEKLHVEAKELLTLTNKELGISFSISKESSNSFMNVSVSTHKESPPFFYSITLDKLGVNRLLSVITNLPSRRERFITFRDDQEKIARQRREAQQNEKARTDELLR